MSSVIYNRAEGTATLVRDDGEQLVVAIGEEDQAGLTFFGPPPVPASVTPLQMRKALRHLGLKATVDAYVATLDGEAAEEWEYALAIERGNATLQAAAVGLGMTDEQADDLFRLAASM